MREGSKQAHVWKQLYLLITYRCCTSVECNLVTGSQIINFLMIGELRPPAEGLFSLRARKAKYLIYRYIRLEASYPT